MLLFSYAEPPADHNVILCPMGSRAQLGRVYLVEKGRVLFEPSVGDEAPSVLTAPIENSGYKLIALYGSF